MTIAALFAFLTLMHNALRDLLVIHTQVDFKAYRHLADLYLSGTDVYRLAIDCGYHYLPYPPPFYWLAGLFSSPMAWMALCLCCVAASVWMMSRKADWRTVVFITCASAALGNDLYMGQANTLTLALLCWLLVSKTPLARGLIVAAMSCIKPYWIVLAIPARSWWSLVGPALWLVNPNYLKFLWGFATSGVAYSRVAVHECFFPSAFGFFVRVGGSIPAAKILAAIVVLWILSRIWRSRDYLAWVCLILAASPMTQEHYLVMLIPLCVTLARDKRALPAILVLLLDFSFDKLPLFHSGPLAILSGSKFLALLWLFNLRTLDRKQKV